MTHINNTLKIGILINNAEPDSFHNKLNDIIQILYKDIAQTFPHFAWSFEILKRNDFPQNGHQQDPLELLEWGSTVKLEYNFDFVLICTSAPLKPRFQQVINAVPSNMLEAAVISTARLKNSANFQQALLALCKHNLGHLWGLEHNEKSVMNPMTNWTKSTNLHWTEEEKKHIQAYLNKIADPRLEETSGGSKLGKLFFYLHVLKQEGFAIMRDIFLFRSWLMMLHLGKFTVATAISIIFLFLSAEAWEMGAALQSPWLNPAIGIILLLTTSLLYFGQNLHKIAHFDKMMEQAVRSKLVLFGTLLTGITAFWLNLFFISLIIIYILPHSVLIHWAGLNASLPMLHFAKIMATFGIMASALGGNLEETQDIKAALFYTEET